MKKKSKIQMEKTIWIYIKIYIHIDLKKELKVNK